MTLWSAGTPSRGEREMSIHPARSGDREAEGL